MAKAKIKQSEEKSTEEYSYKDDVRDIADMCVTTYGEGDADKAFHNLNAAVASKDVQIEAMGEMLSDLDILLRELYQRPTEPGVRLKVKQHYIDIGEDILDNGL